MRMKRMIALLLLCPLLAAACFALAENGTEYSWDFVRKIPLKKQHMQEVESKGTVTTLSYTTHSYALEAVSAGNVEFAHDDNPTIPDVDKDALCGSQTEFILEKQLYVYLPYGYDPGQKYDVVYVLHGTGENEAYWLGDTDMGKKCVPMLDRMIETGACRPVIVVAPTYYSVPEDKAELFGEGMADDSLANAWPMYFWMEMRNDIIALIDETYSTYGSDPDARDHWAFAGLSRGSMTTINSMMMHCLDQFAYFGNYAGLWCDFEAFRAALESDEYRDLDVKFWYNGNGENDFALENHQEFLETCLAEMPDRFADGENVAWISFKNGAHAMTCWLPDLYNSLLVFFTR